MNKHETKVHRYWLDTILTESRILSEWELSFLRSVKLSLDMGLPISDKQEGSLEQLYEKKTR